MFTIHTYLDREGNVEAHSSAVSHDGSPSFCETEFDSTDNGSSLTVCRHNAGASEIEEWFLGMSLNVV